MGSIRPYLQANTYEYVPLTVWVLGLFRLHDNSFFPFQIVPFQIHSTLNIHIHSNFEFLGFIGDFLGGGLGFWFRDFFVTIYLEIVTFLRGDLGSTNQFYQCVHIVHFKYKGLNFMAEFSS